VLTDRRVASADRCSRVGDVARHFGGALGAIHARVIWLQ
jgi:hypothetical protein